MLEKVLGPILALAGVAAMMAEPENPGAAAPAPEGGEPFSPKAAVQLLGHDDYKQRVAAQQALREWGAGTLDEGIAFLYDIYTTTGDPEIRMRSRQVLKHLVIQKQPFDGQGYLGIQMDNRNPHQARNDKGELQPAVLVTLVHEGTAAEAAKIQQNDFIIGVDKVAFDGLAAPHETLQQYIMSKKPGDEITVHVRRGDETLSLTASLRRRSPLLDQRLNEWGPLLVLPPQDELDEADFQDWLKDREEARRKQEKEGGAADPS